MREKIESYYRGAETGSVESAYSTATALRALMAIESIVWTVDDSVRARITTRGNVRIMCYQNSASHDKRERLSLIYPLSGKDCVLKR